ncbi:unnamed protein product [Cuscuta campestris]|uniref:Bromo domain-containing protein n=1 Tax=Cuscuta campestris TaxID=132261 RepID=A0A484MSA0_9ASTE|nr:unnamed protein product [Cuscuta campestris]
MRWREFREERESFEGFRERKGVEIERMGQIVRRGRKGRPPKADLGGSRRAATAAETEGELRRSSRRRNVKYTFDFDDFLDDEDFEEEEEEEDDEDDGRKEKKLELLLKLQGEDELTRSRNRQSSHAQPASASDEEDDEEDDKPSKKRRISRRHDDEYEENEDGEEGDDADDNENGNQNDFEECGRKAEARSFESSPGTPSGRPSPFPLPDKKMLEIILDKLQKKDIYGVYAEPVDPEELPDYHDVIEHPMDFSTVRNKLRNGSYATLEQFESDVFLICSNAMQYNDSDTIYYKQASSIQELATRKFQKIRVNVEHTERLEKVKSDPRPKSSPLVKKHIKKPVGRTVQESAGSDFSSGATLANAGDAQNDSNAFPGTSGRINSTDGPTDGNVLSPDNLDMEELHSGKGHLHRCGRKSALQDENRRATYEISTQSACTSLESLFSTFEAEIKHLVPVGLYADHSYARSLACFAATLGPIAWEFASRRITQALPPGLKFGRGWIGEYEPLPSTVLMLKNHTLKEPSFLAKSTQKVKVEKKKVEMMEPKSMYEVNQQYVCPKPPTPNNIESKPFFLGSGKKPPNSSSPRYDPQNCPSPNFIKPEKKLIRQFELNSQPLPCNQSSFEPSKVANNIIEVPAGSKNRNLSSSSAPSQLLDAKGKDNSRHSNAATRLSSVGGSDNVNKGVTLFPHGQGHGPSDSNNASAVAARAWMSMGALGGFKQASESQISAESLYNPSHNFQLQNLQYRPSSGMHFLPGKGIYPFHAFMPHTARGVVGIEGQVPNRPVMFPQFVGPIDPSRFHPRQNLNSHSAVQSRLNRESVPPPDLNISFQSAGSPPSRPSSGILVDSQQPDLALQL